MAEEWTSNKENVVHFFSGLEMMENIEDGIFKWKKMFFDGRDKLYVMCDIADPRLDSCSDLLIAKYFLRLEVCGFSYLTNGSTVFILGRDLRNELFKNLIIRSKIYKERREKEEADLMKEHFNMQSSRLQQLWGMISMVRRNEKAAFKLCEDMRKYR